MTSRALGRIHVPDERDRNYPMAAVVPQRSARTWRYWWARGAWLDQNGWPECVVYSWAHLLEDGPVTFDGPAFTADLLHSWYDRAQRIDQWPGEDYDGTSVRAGADILRQEGLISEYRWAWDLDTVIRAVLEAGPVVVGTTWYEGMSRPASDGFVSVSGSVQGGHAYVLNGVNTHRKVFRIKNSWGREWANRGHAWITFDDFAYLLRERGEACLPVEVDNP